MTPLARVRCCSTVSSVHLSVLAESPVELTEELIRRHQLGLWRYVRFLGADRELADDLVQETFLQVMTARPDDRGDHAVAGWLRRTALNMYRNTRRRPRKNVVLDADALEQFWQEEVGDDTNAYIDALRGCLATLDDKSRAAVVLRYCEGHDRNTVAQKLKLHLEGCRSVLRRARARLHLCIESKLRNEP